MYSEDFRIPQRGVLLHIGPHKTGTTSIQGALHNARPQLARHGVVYAGKARQHQRAALALTGSKGLWGDRAPQLKDWEQLVRDVKRVRRRRVIVSSEFFDGATDEIARQVVDQLGGDRIHVVVTLRPLAKILPSAWQQHVRNRLRLPYDRWLDNILNHPDEPQHTPSFWKRHDHAAQVERWASIVGPDRLLVVVVDEGDREFLMRAFEQLVDLPKGLLQPESGWTNRSLTAAEIELIRAMNIEFYQRKWPARLYHKAIRLGIVNQMQQRATGPGEPRITTPAWAVARANEMAAAATERIVASRVRVMGDMATLSAVVPEPPEQQVALDSVSLTVAGVADAVIGALDTEWLVSGREAEQPRG